MSAAKPDGAKGPAVGPRVSQLVGVSNKLAELISSLQRSREALQSRVGGPAPTPPGEPPARELDGATTAAAPRDPGEDASLGERLEELEAANRSVGDELVGLQAQIAHAVSLSVTLRRLHEAADRAEVLDGLAEAVVSILGCERFVVLLAEGESLRPARTMGLAAGRAETLAAMLGAPVAGGRLLTGAKARAVDLSLTALVPLAARGRVIGAIAMEAFLPQRGALGPLDAEVMELLGLHGALAHLAAPEGARG